jgi:hypothetical protein
MTSFDLPNLLCMFDESLSKIIRDLRNGKLDAALARSIETQKTFRKVMDKIGYTDEQVLSKI